MDINKDYINKFKVTPTGTLFEPDFRDIREGICPFCTHKMRRMFLKNLWLCKNKIHGSKVFKIKEPDEKS